MTKPKIHTAAALLLALFAAVLLVAGCHHIEPRTHVFGPVTCQPKPKQREDKCSTCVKASCCAEYLACANDAPCPCGYASRLGLLSAEKRAEICGPMNAAYTGLASCMDAKCDDCPVDDALHKHPLIGKPAPEILAETVGGEGPKTLKEAAGKVVVLDFWATWCGPCKASFPKYQEIADRFPGDVVVLAISVDDPEHATQEKLLAFAKDTRVRFSILWDTHLRMETRYAMPKGLPTSFVIDRAGTVRSVHVGYDAAMQPEIEALLKSPVSPPPQQGGPPP